MPMHHMLGLATLIRNQNWNVALARIVQSPQEAGEDLQALTKGGFLATGGLTPLHFACERRPPIEVVEALIAAWPEAVTTSLCRRRGSTAMRTGHSRPGCRDMPFIIPTARKGAAAG